MPPDFPGAYSRATAVNNLGVVVGTTVPADEGSRRGFLFDTRTGDVIELEGLGGDEADPQAINDAGVIVGSAENAEGRERAVIWSPPAYEPLDLGTLGGPFSYANDVNNAGVVVGQSAVGPTGPVRAFVYDPADPGLVALPTLGGDNGQAYGISGAGDVVGDADTAGGDTHAFVWDSASEEITDLGTLGGNDSVAYDLNDSGMVVGMSEFDTDPGLNGHAFVYDPVSDALTDLGTFGGETSMATGINELGIVVGGATLSGELSAHAFLYDTGLWTPALMDLGTFPGSESTWPLGVSDVGHVVGQSRPGPDGTDRDFAWLLAPWTFRDVGPGHVFFDDIEWMALAGISTGFPDDTYRPAEDVTRQSMAAFLYRLAGSPAFTPPGTATFPDVPTSHPFFEEVEWLVSEDITTGFPDGGYHPGGDVTRQSMSAFLYRLAGEPSLTVGTPTFSDVPWEHPFFGEIEWMAAHGITTGFPGGTFRPGSPVTRQTMSAFMHRYADFLGAP